jgi:copper(I)-binding protein
MRFNVALVLAALVASGTVVARGSLVECQPTVRASAAWIQAPPAGSTEATAFVTIDNGTMYDIYVVGAAADAAAGIELRDASKGAAPEAMKEVLVPAYGRLEMALEGVHLHLESLQRPLAAGDIVKLAVYTDGGEQLAVSATVK